ncbi:MAG: LysR family transcriptional regulator [Dethiobacter sp.]|nr:MAG: LysR family transcriptional regulator [Dethiobacter sp.]
MNLNHLDAFCLVVKTGSITKAAKKLHISQPALSLQIQDLEDNFQTVLLERSNKGVRATEMGQLVFNYGQKILNLTKNLQKEIDNHMNTVKEELFVGASSTIGNFALPCSIYIFKEKFSKNNIYLDISDTKNVVEKLIEGSINIGVIEGPLVNSFKELIKSEDLRVKKIAQDELVIVAPYNEEWQDKNEINRKELRELKLILREKGSGIRETIEETFLERNIPLNELNIVLELNSINAIVSAVTAERGTTILPKMALRKELRHRTLKGLKVEGLTFNHPIYLIYYPNGNGNKPNLSSSFIDFLISKERGFC